MILHSDGTYKFDRIQGVGLNNSGTWKTGGIDGMFEFKDENGNLSDWASPSSNINQSTLSFEYRSNNDDWKNTKRILFIKKSNK